MSGPQLSGDRIAFMELLVKAADVSNPAKATPLYLAWTDRILEEFYAQVMQTKYSSR